MKPNLIIPLISLWMMWGIAVAPADVKSGDHTENERLPSCTGSRNCVSSQSDQKQQAIEPLSFRGSPEEAFACLKRILSATERAKLVTSGPESLRVEFRTRLGFVDDAHFLMDSEHELIHMYSASRVGSWDFGVNRKRLEKIRVNFRTQCP